MGTLINALAIIAGSLIGLVLKKGINIGMESAINKSLGLAVIVIGINGFISNMFSINGGKLESKGELMLVVYLVVGTVIGTALHLDDRLNGIGAFLEKRFKLTDFSTGFVNASLLFCIGAMAIVGALNDGLLHDPEVLIIKSALDFTAAIILSASMGIGVLASFVPVLVYEGGITLAAGALGGVLQGALLGDICTVGYVIIFAIGINFLFAGKIKTANLLPCLLLPCVAHLIFAMLGR
ncbi:MAG: DUF554 domain-containing protein [Oscillospiraceae bacterium]